MTWFSCLLASHVTRGALLDIMNSFADFIRFDIAAEGHVAIPFLDLELRIEKEQLRHRIYRKPQNKYMYIQEIAVTRPGSGKQS